VQLSEVCVLDVACCSRQTTVREAARLMRKHHIGDLVVVDDPDGARSPAGIITDRDIVIEVLGKDLDATATLVGDVMVKYSNLVMARDTEDVDAAAERMLAHGVRRLPVVDRAGSLVGVVTLDDLLKLHARHAGVLADIATKQRSHEQRSRR
jgi:CBS domain-containing protein